MACEASRVGSGPGPTRRDRPYSAMPAEVAQWGRTEWGADARSWKGPRANRAYLGASRCPHGSDRAAARRSASPLVRGAAHEGARVGEGVPRVLAPAVQAAQHQLAPGLVGAPRARRAAGLYAYRDVLGHPG